MLLSIAADAAVAASTVALASAAGEVRPLVTQNIDDQSTVELTGNLRPASAFKKAYGAAKGWDFATGIGTLNVTNLVNDW
jgi:hypothetical protein